MTLTDAQNRLLLKATSDGVAWLGGHGGWNASAGSRDAITLLQLEALGFVEQAEAFGTEWRVTLEGLIAARRVRFAEQLAAGLHPFRAAWDSERDRHFLDWACSEQAVRDGLAAYCEEYNDASPDDAREEADAAYVCRLGLLGWIGWEAAE